MKRLTLTCAVAVTALFEALVIPAFAQSPVPATGSKPVSPPETRASGTSDTKPAAKPLTARKLTPVDEGSTDATWVQFRAWLLEALQRGDRRAIAGIVDSNVLNALEAPRGIAEFRKTWNLDGEGTDNQLLRDLSIALQMGSAWYQPKKGARMVCAPYVPIKWPLDDVDPYDSGAIVVKDTLVKDAPSHMATTLGNLSYDIVAVRDWEVTDKEQQLQQRWVKIRFAGDGNARDGFVPAEHIRSAIEHRACFARTGAGWRLAEYVLGIEYLGGPD